MATVTGLLDYIIMGKMPPFDEDPGLKTDDEFIRELHAHVQHGRTVLPALFFHAMYARRVRMDAEMAAGAVQEPAPDS